MNLTLGTPSRGGEDDRLIKASPAPRGWRATRGAAGYRWSFGITNFRPDQVSSIAHTLISTRPSGSAASRTTTSLKSLSTPDDFFGHDTQIMPPGAIALR